MISRIRCTKIRLLWSALPPFLLDLLFHSCLSFHFTHSIQSSRSLRPAPPDPLTFGEHVHTPGSTNRHTLSAFMAAPPPTFTLRVQSCTETPRSDSVPCWWNLFHQKTTDGEYFWSGGSSMEPFLLWRWHIVH